MSGTEKILKDEALFRVILIKQFPFLKRSVPKTSVIKWTQDNLEKIRSEKTLSSGRHSELKIPFPEEIPRNNLLPDLQISENFLTFMYGYTSQSTFIWDLSTSLTVFHRKISEEFIFSNRTSINSKYIAFLAPHISFSKSGFVIYKFNSMSIFREYKIKFTPYPPLLKKDRLFYLDQQLRPHQIYLKTDKLKCLLPDDRIDLMANLGTKICFISAKGSLKYWDIEKEKTVFEKQLEFDESEKIISASAFNGYVFIMTSLDRVFTHSPSLEKPLISNFRVTKSQGITIFSGQWLLSRLHDGSCFIIQDLRCSSDKDNWWPIILDKKVHPKAIVDYPYLFTKELDGPIKIYHIETNAIVGTYDQFGKDPFFAWKNEKLIGLSKDSSGITILDFSKPSSKK